MCEQRAIMSTRWGLGKHDLRPEDDDDGGFTLPCPPLGDARQDDDSEEEAAVGARPRGWNAVNTREHCDDWDDDDELSTPPQAASRVALDASRSSDAMMVTAPRSWITASLTASQRGEDS